MRWRPRSADRACELDASVRRDMQMDLGILSEQYQTLNGCLSEAAHNKSGDKAVAPFGGITLNKHAVSGGREDQQAAQPSERNMDSNV